MSDARIKALGRLQKTFKKKVISIEAREGSRYWVSNGNWLAYVHRSELHILLPTMPVDAFGALAKLESGKGIQFTEEGLQFDFGGMFPVLEQAYKQTEELHATKLVYQWGDLVQRLCYVNDRLVAVDPDYFDALKMAIDPERITGVDELGIIGFWKDEEIIGALMPMSCTEEEIRGDAASVIATRKKPEDKAAV